MDFHVSEQLMIEGRASTLVLTVWDGRTYAWLWRKKIERPHLIFTVLGGRTTAWLNYLFQASSPYVGWLDKPTVTQLICRGPDGLLPTMLNLLVVTIWTLHCFDVNNQTSSPYHLWYASKSSHYSDAVELNSSLYCSVILACSKMVKMGMRLVSSQASLLPTMVLYCTIIIGFCKVQLNKKVE